MGPIRSVPPALVGCLLFVLFGCEPSGLSPAAPLPPPVLTTAIVQRDVPIHREWVGTVDSQVNASISAQVSGYLAEQIYEEGRPVTKDQILFQIEKAPYEAVLARAQAQLQSVQAVKSRTSADLAGYRSVPAGGVSPQEMNQAIQADLTATANVTAAEAAVKEAQLNLDFTSIRSPVSGRAGTATVHLGELIGPSSGSLTTVVRTDPMRVFFSVSQKFMTEVTESLAARGKPIDSADGVPLNLILAGDNPYPLAGAIRFAGNHVDIHTGTVSVVGEFPNPQNILLPGMFARVRALVRTDKAALLVPQRARIEVQGRNFLALVGDDDTAHIVQVTATDQVGSDCIVQGPIKAGDRIVVEGVQKVRDGAKVAPSPWVPPQAASTTQATRPG
jgi:membrane fusion protein (multidrug efflux system)